ncbi:MAG: methylmalonyl-CoA mutase family protein, partial [bacterium]
VNGYVMEDEHLEIPLLKIDEAAARTQFESIAKAKQIRDQKRVDQTLEALRQCCRDGQNTMPFIIDCVREYATLGEICLAMKDIYGGYDEPVII